MNDPKNLSILDYTYDLPEERIASHPLPERDASKLLIYQNGEIKDDLYQNIVHYLPEKSLMVFNDSRVIKARIVFQKSTGGLIELFCLEPNEPINDYSSVMNKTGSALWKCMIGGLSKWKQGSITKALELIPTHKPGDNLILNATLVEQLPDAHVVLFSWSPADLSFAEVLEMAGDIPLPPYIKRKTAAADNDRYQTIYARQEGSVAAPTAGLHFTKSIMDSLVKKNISTAYLTLHVGAGTFKPVKADKMDGHAMHSEWIEVNSGFISRLLEEQQLLVAVGTTSLRTLETIYWLGVKALLDPKLQSLSLGQWEVYESPMVNQDVPIDKALNAVLDWLKKNGSEKIFTTTQLLIAPGYRFRLAKALVTNFHQPKSTLLMLVAAATGNNWRMIYDHALKNDFRFLSYGDGSLIFLESDKAIA